MSAALRVAVLCLVATSVGGCALAGRGQTPLSADLGFADTYSLTAAAAPEQAASPDTDHWWTLFGDPLLTDLVSRARRGSAKADIAKAYIGVRVQQARIADARDYLAAQQQTREIARFRSEAKLVTERDALQIDAESARVAARIPSLEAAMQADAARVAVAAGAAPGAFRDRLATPAPIPAGPDAVPVGRPSDLLERRPDLRRRAARIEVAGWLLGTSSATLASDRQAVRRAEEGVEDALAAFSGARARVQALVDALAKADQVARLAREQYHDGLADYDAVSKAEAALLETRDALAESQAQRARALIDLCMALGERASGAAASK